MLYSLTSQGEKKVERRSLVRSFIFFVTDSVIFVSVLVTLILISIFAAHWFDAKDYARFVQISTNSFEYGYSYILQIIVCLVELAGSAIMMVELFAIMSTIEE